MTLIHSIPLKSLAVHVRQILEKTGQCRDFQWGIDSTLQLVPIQCSIGLGPVLACLREVGLKVHTAVMKPLISRKNQKAKLILEKRTGPKFTSVMKAYFIYLGLIGNIFLASN